MCIFEQSTLQSWISAPYYPLTVSVNECDGSWNIIDDTNARVRVRNNVKKMNVKQFNLMPVANETIFSFQHEPCECKNGLNESVCNSRQEWNHD